MSAAALHAPCDKARAAATLSRSQAAHPRLVLATTILASSLAFIDGSVVNVALPTIGRDLGADAGGLQWIVNAYLLPLGALLLLGGAAGDRYGRRVLLVAGTLVFGLASLGCALAPGLGALLGFRLLQGAGAAMLMPNSLALLGQSFSGEAKGRAIGTWAASGAAMGALGPVLGGWLIDLGSWRAIFLINLPLAAAAIGLAIRYVPRDEDRSDRRLDAAGGVLATAGLALLTWALTAGSGPAGWTRPAAAAAGASAVLLAAFVLAERHRGDDAMMPLSLFASAGFVGLTLLTFLLYGALGALLLLVPYAVISAGGYSGVEAGAALLPLPAVLAVTSPLMGGLASRIGPRLPLVVGPLIVAAGFLLALRIGGSPAYWTEVLPAVLVVAIGLGGAVAPLTTAILTSVDDRHAGSASGFNSAVARTGGMVATALLGAVLAAGPGGFWTAFHWSMIAGAVACAAASLSAFVLVGRRRVATIIA